MSEPPLPHVLAPLTHGALHSFFYRLDRANGWALGDTASLVAIHETGWRSARAASYASGALWGLRRLAQLTDNAPEVIEALVPLPDLRRAAADPNLGIDALGNPVHLHFCAPCLATTDVIPRFCLLPLLQGCPIHRVRFVSFCNRHGTAGYPPEFAEERVRCAQCHETLAAPDGEPLNDDEVAHLIDTWRAWTFLLGWNGDDIRGRGYRTIRSVSRGRVPLRNIGEHASFERLVTVFLALQIEPNAVALMTDPPLPACPNATCPRYVAPGPRDPLTRGRQVERHCSECGCRFVGRRILLCFNEKHGERLPTAHSVRKARRRLERWRLALADVLRQAILDGRPITVLTAFRDAGIPKNANLRAHRLGLVELVQDAARRQRLANGTEKESFRAVCMSDYRFLLDRARQALWHDVFEQARSAGIEPNAPTEELRRYYDDRRVDPQFGLLDPVFPPRWIVRGNIELEDLRKRIAAKRRTAPAPRLLTDRVRERARLVSAGVFVDGLDQSRAHHEARHRDLAPSAREFLAADPHQPWTASMFLAAQAPTRGSSWPN